MQLALRTKELTPTITSFPSSARWSTGPPESPKQVPARPHALPQAVGVVEVVAIGEGAAEVDQAHRPHIAGALPEEHRLHQLQAVAHHGELHILQPPPGGQAVQVARGSDMAVSSLRRIRREGLIERHHPDVMGVRDGQITGPPRVGMGGPLEAAGAWIAGERALAGCPRHPVGVPCDRPRIEPDLGVGGGEAELGVEAGAMAGRQQHRGRDQGPGAAPEGNLVFMNSSQNPGVRL